jgi:hypothetical protein
VVKHIAAPTPVTQTDNKAGRYDWVPHHLSITLRLRTLLIARFNFVSVALDAPITRIPVALPLPPWTSLPSDCDVITIEAQPLLKTTPRFSTSGQSVRYIIDSEVRHLVDLRGSFDGYLRSLEKRTRGNLIRATRQFKTYSGGSIDFREYRSREEMATFLAIGAQISQKTLKHDSHGLCNTGSSATEMLSRAEHGTARGYVLFHENRGISYILCINQSENLRYRKIGYDPDYQSWSPGTVAFYCLLERLYEERAFEYLDFEGHEAPFKARLATLSVPCWRVVYFRRRLKPLGVMLGHFLFTRLLEVSVAGADRLGLKSPIRKLFD